MAVCMKANNPLTRVRKDSMELIILQEAIQICDSWMSLFSFLYQISPKKNKKELLLETELLLEKVKEIRIRKGMRVKDIEVL